MILRNGVRDALLAAVLFGLSVPIAKILVGDLPPQLLAGVLYLGSGFVLTIVVVPNFCEVRRGGMPGVHYTPRRGRL